MRLPPEALRYINGCLHCSRHKSYDAQPDAVANDNQWRHLFDFHFHDYKELHASRFVGPSSTSAADDLLNRKRAYTPNTGNRAVLLWDVQQMRSTRPEAAPGLQFQTPFICCSSAVRLQRASFTCAQC